jgi:hypothetical protein
LRLTREDLGPNPTLTTRELIALIEAMGFEWGVSDGH